MSHLNIKVRLIDHTMPAPDSVDASLGEFIKANEADTDFCAKAIAIVPHLRAGESWRFAEAMGDDYELRRLA